uniref:NACHT LRR and PYD domain-containing protein n=1 Tax=Pundamilia nyererei TaxID=303518 RepID=A0A3B4EX72_9CICH
MAHFCRLSGCLITEEGCTSLTSALSSNPSHLRELDLSYNHPGDSGMKLLLTGLKDPSWRLDTLRLWRCGLSEISCDYLAASLKSNPSYLRELDLSNNNMQDSGVKKLCGFLESLGCGLGTLRSLQVTICWSFSNPETVNTEQKHRVHPRRSTCAAKK